jgi:hypothetical protein
MMIRKPINNMSLQKQNRNKEAGSPSPKGEGSKGEVTKTAMILLLLMLTFIACNRKPFVTSKLKLEKISDDCRNLKQYFRMVSNFAGERYEFEKCLPENFSKEQMKTSRQGDTVVVQFEKTGAKQVLYKLAVDIDSYPKYQFITVDGETFIVMPSKD